MSTGTVFSPVGLPRVCPVLTTPTIYRLRKPAVTKPDVSGAFVGFLRAGGTARLGTPLPFAVVVCLLLVFGDRYGTSSVRLVGYFYHWGRYKGVHLLWVYDYLPDVLVSLPWARATYLFIVNGDFGSFRYFSTVVHRTLVGKGLFVYNDIWGSAGSDTRRSLGFKTTFLLSVSSVWSVRNTTAATPTSSPVCTLPDDAYFFVDLSTPLLFDSYGEWGIFPPPVWVVSRFYDFTIVSLLSTARVSDGRVLDPDFSEAQHYFLV